MKFMNVFFFKQKTAYEILTCDWSSDVSSDLNVDFWALKDQVIGQNPRRKWSLV